MDLRWHLHIYKNNKLFKWGLKNGHISLYTNDLIEKLRNITYGGMPASILLLSHKMCNGNCYDRALLLSKAFLDTEDDINLVYASVNTLKYNPLNTLGNDHCFLERITKDNKHYIYDTSEGLVFEKWIYYLLENPKVRKINDKQAIKDFIEETNEIYPEKSDDTNMLSFIIQIVEETYGKEGEYYSVKGIDLLQREVNLFKEKINYDSIKRN